MDKNNILTLFIGFVIFWGPLWVAVIARILSKNTNQSVLSLLVAIPFCIYSLFRIPFFWDVEINGYGKVVDSLAKIGLMLFGILLTCAIPLLLAKVGVAIGDKITKRNPNQSTHSITASGGSE